MSDWLQAHGWLLAWLAMSVSRLCEAVFSHPYVWPVSPLKRCVREARDWRARRRNNNLVHPN